MSGGVCHLLNENRFGGVYKNYLNLRLSEQEANAAVKSPSVRPFDITGRPMKGWVMVDGDERKDDGELEEWLSKARRFVAQLPPK
jgi:hypothetical protein